MAKLPIVRRLLREDYQGAPQWIDKLIYTINNFSRNISGPCWESHVRRQHKGTNKDFSNHRWGNCRRQRVHVRFHWIVEADRDVARDGARRLWDIRPGYICRDSQLRIGEDSTLVIDAISGLTPSTQYELTVIVI